MKIPIAVTPAISWIETEPRIGCNRSCKHLYPLGKTRRSDRLLTWENSFHEYCRQLRCVRVGPSPMCSNEQCFRQPYREIHLVVPVQREGFRLRCRRNPAARVEPTKLTLGDRDND